MPRRRSPVAKKLLGGLGMEPLGPSFSCRLFIRASKPVGYPSSNYCWREVGGGCWQYLCIRGALSCGNPSHGSGILSGACAYPAAVSSHRAGFGQGDRAGRKQSERFFKCRRIFRAFPERCSGVRPGGITVLRLRHPVKMVRQGQRSSFIARVANVSCASVPRLPVQGELVDGRCYILFMSACRPTIAFREQSGTLIQRTVRPAWRVASRLCTAAQATCRVDVEP